eukprot:TRINITY_DN11502_c1_g1_i1.p1 TRINITY_DN11502_c1_g1~~TRINITY_DN11502_c1_g1_i1.p1  ORF type:complete len:379 (-),score=22.96 TRINITY_DN11502_c1_g1_i1:477-1613(-)
MTKQIQNMKIHCQFQTKSFQLPYSKRRRRRVNYSKIITSFRTSEIRIESPNQAQQVIAPNTRKKPRFFEPVQHDIGKIKFHDKFSEKLVDVEIYIFRPGENIVKNGRLIMISNGAMVGAEKYSQISDRLAMLGYSVIIPNFKINFKFVHPYLNHDIPFPNQIVLHSVLKKLVQREKLQDEQLPGLDFSEVIVLGHSLGGSNQILDARQPEPFLQPLYLMCTKFLPSSKDKYECWDKYVKGIILYEGWIQHNLPVPKNQFLSLIGSQYREELLMKLEQSVQPKSGVTFHIIQNANHFLVNDYQGPKQVVAGAQVARGQEKFVTTFQEWNETQKNLVDHIDLEIRQRLDKNQSDQNHDFDIDKFFNKHQLRYRLPPYQFQ